MYEQIPSYSTQYKYVSITQNRQCPYHCAPITRRTSKFWPQWFYTGKYQRPLNYKAGYNFLFLYI